MRPKENTLNKKGSKTGPDRGKTVTGKRAQPSRTKKPRGEKRAQKLVTVNGPVLPAKVPWVSVAAMRVPTSTIV